jgi:hypothetical protein
MTPAPEQPSTARFVTAHRHSPYAVDYAAHVSIAREALAALPVSED